MGSACCVLEAEIQNNNNNNNNDRNNNNPRVHLKTQREVSQI